MYDKDLDLETLLYCVECRRVYKKGTKKFKMFKDRYQEKTSEQTEIVM